MRNPRYPLLALLVISLGALTGCQGAFFYPEPEHYWDPADAGLVYDDVHFEAADGTELHGWFLPSRTDEVHGTVIHFHGNAQNISAHVAAVWWLPRKGFQVLTFDYRGFGRSAGSPDFSGVHEDGLAALAKARELEEVQLDETVILGQSLGASVAITVTTKWDGPQPAGVAAENPFDSYRGITREKLGGFWLTWPLQIPLSWLVSDAYAPIDRVDQLTPTPILLIAGSEDRTIPPFHSQRLYKAAKEPRAIWVLEGARHNAALADATVRSRLVEVFLGWIEGDADAAASPPEGPWQPDPVRQP